MTVGAGTSSANLTEVFALEGATEVDGEYSAANVSFAFGIPVDGKVTILAEPADASATSFFMKVKMRP